MGAPQEDAGCHLLLVGLQPAGGAQAPAVAGLQTGEAEFRVGGGQVIAAKPRILQKVLGDFHAHRMRADVIVARISAAVAKESGQWVFTAGQQGFAKHVEGFVHSHLWSASC